MSESIQLLRRVSNDYESAAQQAPAIYKAAAESEAEHRYRRARLVLWHKENGDKVSVSEAEARADSDDRLHELYTRRLVTAAAADAHRDRLRQLRERESSARTEVATERESDRIHAARGDRP